MNDRPTKTHIADRSNNRVQVPLRGRTVERPRVREVWRAWSPQSALPEQRVQPRVGDEEQAQGNGLLTVVVPGPGQLTLTGKGLKRRRTVPLANGASAADR